MQRLMTVVLAAFFMQVTLWAAAYESLAFDEEDFHQTEVSCIEKLDKHSFVTADYAGMIKVWRIEQDKVTLVAGWKAPCAFIASLATYGGDTIVVSGLNIKEGITIWNRYGNNQWGKAGCIGDYMSFVNCLKFLNQNTIVLSADQHQVHLWQRSWVKSNNWKKIDSWLIGDFKDIKDIVVINEYTVAIMWQKSPLSLCLFDPQIKMWHVKIMDDVNHENKGGIDVHSHEHFTVYSEDDYQCFTWIGNRWRESECVNHSVQKNNRWMVFPQWRENRRIAGALQFDNQTEIYIFKWNDVAKRAKLQVWRIK